ncbi:ABC transporter permease [Flavilitoribacter nigricans]|uniref:FtsX-like permease family protein n=1 Tax=Flavilitoribacter nigricans (strain ATCC 23147 / DSM 23189 / NBRC 102662 / NCIMB 1420 / SS-2) TaxID=1122177 RepID=A0A2D0N2J5_FLAN2|nr:ABC transporter permease [Flavilitoribacter nigricans]PHN01953.1 hypothetical protein CRP01_34745 [Flavilitoribacter nigricans DSM 23189 = NBRC 102662]
MFRKNLLLAFRHLRRNKLYAFINVIGLAIGIAACLVITSIVHFEMSFDEFRQNRDQIYRVYTSFSGVFDGTNRGVATAVSPWIKENVSGVAYTSPFFTTASSVSPLNEQGVRLDESRQNDLAVVTPDYFSVFSDYQWLSGEPETALSQPNQVVLSDEKAFQYFGVTNPLDAVGRELIYGDSTVMTVSGIFEAPPKNTDLVFQDFISFATVENGGWERNYQLNDLNSTNSSSQLFIRLLPGKQPEDIKAQFASLEEQYAQENDDHGFFAHYQLQPFSEIHFNSELGIFDNSRSPAHRSTLYVLIGVAILLLIVAAINFVNLETAQSIRRAREVGVRKVLGGSKENLMGQFLGQTFLLTSISMVVALGLTKLSLWFFSDFIPSDLTFEIGDPSTLLFIAGTTLTVALLAGIYPAFVLSSFRPALALKDRIGSMGKGGGSHNLRRGLVVFQFIIAQVLIFGTLAVGQQIRFMLNKDMGFDKDAIVYFYMPWRDTLYKDALVAELERWPEILTLSRHEAPPAENGYSSNVMNYKDGGEEKSLNVFRKFGDTSYIHLYGIELMAGRNLLPSDTVKEMLINETFARQMGYQQPADAIGKLLSYNKKQVPVVGIVSDFHTRSLHEPIVPVAIANRRPSFGAVGIKLPTAGGDADQLEGFISRLESKWKEFYPDENFNYHFLDESIANFYEAEQRTAKLVRTATLVAILISCLGLFGLVSFAANQRTKEIGVRKVLGATVSNIVGLLSREFLILVAFAFAIAIPFAWWATTKWLTEFTFRIELSWWLFALCGGLALLIAFLTMSIQAIRAALNNPVESLRSE